MSVPPLRKDPTLDGRGAPASGGSTVGATALVWTRCVRDASVRRFPRLPLPYRVK